MWAGPCAAVGGSAQAGRHWPAPLACAHRTPAETSESQPDAACRTTNVPGGRVTQLESLGHLLGRGHQTDLTKPADRPPAVACSPQEKGCSPSQAIAPLRSPLSTPPSHLPGGALRGRPRGSQ